MKTLKDLALEAIEIQHEEHLSTLAPKFSRAIADLRYCLPAGQYFHVNTHPICILWTCKLANLTGLHPEDSDGNQAVLARALTWAHELVAPARPGFCSCGQHGCHDVRHRVPAP